MMHDEDLHDLYLSLMLYKTDEMKEGAMGNACSMHGRGEKCIENFGWKI
jgi:hypothetical protein